MSSPTEHNGEIGVAKGTEAETFDWDACVTCSTWNVATHKELGIDGKGEYLKMH